MTDMNSRRRILAALSGEETDRVPLMEIVFYPETRTRWISEGMPGNVSPWDYFGLDKIAILPLDSSLGLPSKIVQEDESYYTVSDGNGVTFRHKKGLPYALQFVSATVTDSDLWNKYRSCLEPTLSRFEYYNRDFVFGQQLPYTVKEQYEQVRKENIFTVYSPTEPCWFFLNLLGEEEALCTISLDPDFVEQVMADYTQFNIDMLDLIYNAGYRFDALWVFADLCYKNGMLFSPDFFRQRVAAYQKKMFNRAKELGMRIIYHSDGYVGDIIPLLIDVGVECIQPLEVRAGNDVRNYQGKYSGKLSFIGNINADALAAGKEAIYREISEKLPAVKASRRYIFHSDHSIPNTVSLENYQYAIDLAKEYLWN
jgi:uroporphyrinogen decarboxylase